MDYYLTSEEYKAFLKTLPPYHYEAKFKRLKPFLQKLTENIVQYIFPNEGVEWLFDIPEYLNEDARTYLIKTQLPENIHKSDVNFIPENRLDFIKTSYIKATLSLYYEEVHPRAGDSYDGWFIEILVTDETRITLQSSDPNIYVIGNCDINYFRYELPKWIKNSI